MWFLFGAVTTVAAATVMGYRKYTAAWSGKHAGGFEYTISTDKYDKVTDAKVAVAHDAAFDFEVQPESGADRWFKSIGAAIEHQVGDRPFDNRFYIVSDDAAVRVMFVGSLELRAALSEIFTPRGIAPVKRVVCRRGRLWIEMSGGGGNENTVLQRIRRDLVPPLQRAAAELKARRLLPSTRRDPLFLKSVLVLAASTGLVINGVIQLGRIWIFHVPFTLDAGQLVALSLLGAAVLLVFLCGVAFLLLGRSSRLHLVLLEVLLVGTLGASMTSFAELRDMNMELDTSEVQAYATDIVRKTTHRGRRGSRSYYLHLRNWHDTSDTVRVRVTRSEYDAKFMGQRVEVRERAGALGMRWVESMR